MARKSARVAGASLAVFGLAGMLGVGTTSPMTEFFHTFLGALLACAGFWAGRARCRLEETRMIQFINAVRHGGHVRVRAEGGNAVAVENDGEDASGRDPSHVFEWLRRGRICRRGDGRDERDRKRSRDGSGSRSVPSRLPRTCWPGGWSGGLAEGEMTGRTWGKGR